MTQMRRRFVSETVEVERYISTYIHLSVLCRTREYFAWKTALCIVVVLVVEGYF